MPQSGRLLTGEGGFTFVQENLNPFEVILGFEAHALAKLLELNPGGRHPRFFL